MEVNKQPCKECGATDWSELFSKDYPERRSERDRTVETGYRCQNCGAEGKHFEHKDGGRDTLSGALG